MSIALKQNNVVSTDRRNVALCAAILGDLLSPDYCRFIMLGSSNSDKIGRASLLDDILI